MPPENNPSKIPSSPQSEPPVSPLKQIRTFQGDIANALERQKESIYSIQQTEHLKRVSGGMVISPLPDQRPRRKRIFLYIIGSVILLSFASFRIWNGYLEFRAKSQPQSIDTPDNRFVAAQESVDLNVSALSTEAFFAKIGEASSGTPTGELRHVILHKGEGEAAPLASTSDFFQITASRAPGALIRSFEELFMMGTLGESHFLIFKLISYESAFGGMLDWEQTLAEDIGPLFATSAYLKNITPEHVFKDVVSRNKDTRLLSAPIELGSSTTTPALLYSFFDNEVLIITDKMETLHTLIERLTREKLSR